MSRNMVRRVRIRGLREGLVQKGRIEGLEPDARDLVERFQDYGFSANPVDGQGLRMEVGGHTFIVRMDRLDERPQQDAYEVSVWHKERHHVTLRAGRVVDVECDQLNIVATAGVHITTPTMLVTGDQITTGNAAVGGNQVVMGTATATTVVGLTNVIFAGISGKDHDHGNVQHGTDRTDGPAS